MVGSDGHLQGAMEMIDDVTLSPLAVEVKAILHGLRLLQHLQISQAQIFSDSLCTINMIKGDTTNTS